MKAQIRDLQDYGCIFRTKVLLESHITYLHAILNIIPLLLFLERRTAVLQIDETYRKNKYGAGMFHVISSTSTHIKYTLAFCFLQSEKQVKLTWIT